MSRTSDPSSKKVMAYFTPQEHHDVKSECVALGMSFTDYIIHLREKGRAQALARVRKARK